MGGRLTIAFSALAITTGAVLGAGAAPHFSTEAQVIIAVQKATEAASFRLQHGRGLLVQTWLNGKGPYTFALDTGAGINVVTERLVNDARLPVEIIRRTTLSGLTGASGSTNREATIDRIALGHPANTVAFKQSALIVAGLPQGLDGILDPTQTFSPSGYSIDFSSRLIERFSGSLRGRVPPPGGAIVPWLRKPDGPRPFVKLNDGRLALIDTGSGFGLAVSSRDAVIVGGRNARDARVNVDLGGGSISSRRVAPTTVGIGELELRGVPTDILFGIDADTPVLLGRDALQPFKLTFDPRSRLIEFRP